MTFRRLSLFLAATLVLGAVGARAVEPRRRRRRSSS
jgi:hypothetical protein